MPAFSKRAENRTPVTRNTSTLVLRVTGFPVSQSWAEFCNHRVDPNFQRIPKKSGDRAVSAARKKTPERSALVSPARSQDSGRSRELPQQMRAGRALVATGVA